jgi:multidrug resistance efflux pump
MKLLVLMLLLAALGWTGPALAGIPSTRMQVAAPTDRATWVEAIRHAREDLAAARARYEEARKAYSKMKQRRKARGARKEALVRERDEAADALAEAERSLEQLLQSARRAGVPPGRVREAMEPESDPANQADD